MSIPEQLEKIKNELPQHVKLIAVSKTHPVSVIMEAYNAGHKFFGENRVQELISKYDEMPKDIEWHLIGHLQTNKVKYIAPFVSLIHSVDSLKLLSVIDKEAQKCNRVIDCLLQVYIASEETKFGLSADELHELLQNQEFEQLQNVRVCGLMGMATFTDNMEQVRMEFRFLKKLFNEIKQTYFQNQPWFNELSMGMSSDYRIAIEEGSTMVRIGSNIFGHRSYT
ncbi:MAG: YggS family pyridoxal phosphate-dependent enzyme [Tenuifilum sp.]|uniref:YggS family pyridoxal phosphate-dependent enzyme n=1 Tax=Tenuifilum sp. TaxID=2760880 RepID=UPI001B62C800|nr:YggS family pyridoxal phosphate-dependent enzyme [Bacteroidales bacterium]HOK60270.1 YggS family pyridoxal phosphate-dependent enzyme [Tenuifilum sp.]MBP9030323.1 YggS family pyridoxal phosphate-dependent enzyme [Bacteroidales bacterium]HOK85282.1 YggS family pyridoxal phosphate-dependent enzyme [Tenuifilum sp.]HON70064.1 YggS family pyridoxal phosphate-dependent enzyme [Tenuifilum sp.]